MLNKLSIALREGAPAEKTKLSILADKGIAPCNFCFYPNPEGRMKHSKMYIVKGLLLTGILVGREVHRTQHLCGTNRTLIICLLKR